jgi:hypothetical protein
VVRDAYYAERRSVTARLLQALQAANGLLLEENEQSLRSDQLTAGISCAVLREQDLFVALAGPAALYVVHGDEVSRLPEASPWIDDIPMEQANMVPLGSRRDAHVELYHKQVSGGDAFVQVNEALARALATRAWHSIMRASSLEAIAEGLVSAGQISDLSALVVRIVPGGRGSAAPPLKTAKKKVVPAPVPDSEPGVPQSERPRKEERFKGAGKAMAAVGAGTVGFFKQMVPGQSRPPHSAKSAPAQKPPKRRAKSRRARAKPPARSQPVQRLLIAIAIIIPLVVAGVVAYTVIQRGQTQRAETDELWLSAQSLWVQADSASDPVTVRNLLGEAQRYLDQLLIEQPDHADGLALQKSIASRLEDSNKVRRVNWSGELASYPGGADLSRIAVDGGHVFVLDKNADLVYHHQLDEYRQAILPHSAETVLVRKGDLVGDALVGDLVDMIWMPVGNGRQKAALVILESDGSLLEYDPATESLVALRVAATDRWQYPEFVGSHSGRFYLLDSAANQILRYGPTADGYSAMPESWLQTEVDLSGVQDMAVGDSIFLLYADGTVQKLSAGVPDSFDISDWDTPPQAATAIYSRPPNETQWLYVADPGNSRIVQASKEGQFRQQYRLADSLGTDENDALSGVTSLFVDEIGGRVYFLSNNRLHMLILPD